MDDPRISQKKSGIDIDKELIQGSTYHKNVSQAIVVTTEDKIRLCLIDYKDSFETQKNWIAPAGIFIALVIALIATDFRQFLGLSSEVWKALFIFGSILSAYLFLRALIKAIKLRGYDNIESIIEKLKQGS